MKRHILIAATATMLAFASSAAMAAQNMFTEMDVNDDNRVSKSEFQDYAMSSGIYDRWDVNNDGKVTQEEFAEVLYLYYDDNQDGYIDDAEWEDGLMIDDYGDDGLWDT